MNKRRNFLLINTGVMLTTIMLTGCAKEENVDYHISGVEDAVQSEEKEIRNGKSAVSQFEGETHWSDVWTVETEKETVEITIETDVILPDAEDMYVVEVSIPEMDETYRERVVNEIFDSPEVSHLASKDENEEDDLYPVEGHYEADQYVGERDGVSYILWFNRIVDEDKGDECFSQWINFYASDAKDVCPKKYEGYSRYMPHRYMTVDKYANVGENECAISMEEAQQIAEDFMEEFNLEYPVLNSVRPLIWGDETLDTSTMYSWPANGYVFTFHYGAYDVSFSGATSYANNNYVEDEETEYPISGYADVYVTECGVVCMYADNPVETVNMSGEVKLLPLETIKEIMEEVITEKYEEFPFVHLMSGQKLTFDRMELIYFRVRDKENPGKYSFVPAWRLSENVGETLEGDIFIQNPVLINAIDGTLINYFEET